MFIAKTVEEIRSQIKGKKSTALVPTMGALHEGHLALIKKAREISEIVIVSIFVNKAQFNDVKDYEKYPRLPESDLDLLKNSGATHVFLPDDSEIFPQGFLLNSSLTTLANCLCGISRPGHFDGVILVITRFFDIIKPNMAIFGEKDFQQFAIIKELASNLGSNVKIIGHKTIREESGLALSSRNKNLSKSDQERAKNIFIILSQIKIQVEKSPNDIENILQESRDWFLNNGFEKIDYLEIREEEKLKLVNVFNSSNPSRIFIAVYLNGVRLIDNLPLN